MSYHQHGRGSPHGIPTYPQPPSRSPRDLLPSQGRRAPPNNSRDVQAPRDPAAMTPTRPQPNRLHKLPPALRAEKSTESLYDGSAYGEPEYVEQQGDWPLPTNARQPQAQSDKAGSSPTSGSGRRPPTRPQRPDAPSQVLEQPPAAIVAPASQQHEPPSHHGSGQWTGEGYTSPSSAYAQSQPAYQQGTYGQANKRPPLGPPPSARRGPASYYPQVQPVHPIAEETDSMYGSIRGNSMIGARESTKSYASSNAIPIGISDYYLNLGESVPDLPQPEPPRHEQQEEDGTESPMDPSQTSGKNSRMSNRTATPDFMSTAPSPEPTALVRQASLGKLSKPTLTTVKSGERIRKYSKPDDGLSSLPSQKQNNAHTPKAAAKTSGLPASIEKDVSMLTISDDDRSSYEQDVSLSEEKALEAGVAGTLAAPLYPAAAKSSDNLSHRTHSSELLGPGAHALDSSSSDSDKEVVKAPHAVRGASQFAESARYSPDKEVDPRATILAGLEKGGALSASDAAAQDPNYLPKPNNGLSERAGRRRPPRINVDAVREAEARGSLTSLPDLIKRATRLASNLDRGKTASRLGLHWISAEATDSDNEKAGANMNDRRSGSISDILANFPQPSPALQPGGREHTGNGRRLTNWPSALQHSHLPSNSDAGIAPPRRRKRCCGMPLWLFLLLLIVVILLIAAAIIVPIFLVVVPRQHAHDKVAPPDVVSVCQKQLTCENGGASVQSSTGSCQCICVNGFTGTTCQTQSSAACTTMSVGAATNATVGSAIPRLITEAHSNFSVPLNGQALLGLFSSAGLSCQSQNALVTFDNSPGVKRELSLPPPIRIKVKRQAATSAGIIYDTSSPTATSSGSTASATATATATAKPLATQQDFARVAVLYVLQASGQYPDATMAQTNLQVFFLNNEGVAGQGASDAGNVTLGNGFSCDLNGFDIGLQNGTVVGASH